jgi:hypothetical protein
MTTHAATSLSIAARSIVTARQNDGWGIPFLVGGRASAQHDKQVTISLHSADGSPVIGAYPYSHTVRKGARIQ